MEPKYQNVIDLLWKFYCGDIESFVFILRGLSDSLKIHGSFEDSLNWSALADSVNDSNVSLFVFVDSSPILTDFRRWLLKFTCHPSEGIGVKAVFQESGNLPKT